MGQGGKITLVNSTNSDWKRVHQHSYQMNAWNFPNTIKANTSVSVYVEWDQGIFKTQSDDAGEVDYNLVGTSDVFQIQARAKKGFQLKVYFKNIETQSKPKGSLFSLGWNHDGYVGFILSGTSGKYSSTDLNGDTWMQDNLSVLGTKPLKDICIVGSHDSGMSVKASGTAFASDCNTLTQSKSIQGQLSLGARYFDIRPVISSGKYLTGHYGKIEKAGVTTWQGANGQSIDSIIEDVNSFTHSHRELVVLNLSHSLNTDVGNASYRGFTQQEWSNLFQKLVKLENLYVAPKGTDLTSKSLNDFIATKSAVLVVLEDSADLGTYEGNGFFKYPSFDAYNSYAESNDVGKMANNQFQKMKQNSSRYFLLSWTLTQSSTQASTCFLGTASSIKELASEANQRLIDMVYPKVTAAVFPNIIYIDDIVSSNAAALSMALNWKKELTTVSVAGESELSKNKAL